MSRPYMKTPPAGSFGLRLSRLRHSLGMTTREFAKATGIALTTVYQYERNVSVPKLDKAIQICVKLNVSLEFLAGLSESPVPGRDLYANS
jgi:transcriptional regulator with XRE-family HTH domain